MDVLLWMNTSWNLQQYISQHDIQDQHAHPIPIPIPSDHANDDNMISRATPFGNSTLSKHLSECT